ncbi:MAG: hypothetical protein IT203_12020 [Fimbriimonadaceae bacterium]|nr:hypothetical protein [Fimbriimonadaceae bacterium]
MDIKTILGLTTAIVGTGVVVGQDPSFEYPAVKPVLNSETTNGFRTCADEQQKSVTARFIGARLSEVLDWLGNQGVSFVTSGTRSDAKIDIEFANIPLDEAIQAVGREIGGSFVKRGNIYVFQKGFRPFGFPSAGLDGIAPSVFTELPGITEMATLKKMDGNLPKIFTWSSDGKDGYRAFGKQDPKSDRDWQEIHKQMMKEFGPGSSFMKELHKELGDSKKWEQFGKQFEKQFGPGSPFEKRMRFFGEQEGKKWESLGKQMETQFGPGSPFEGKMKTFKLPNGMMLELDPKEHQKLMKELQDEMKAMRQSFVMPKFEGKYFEMPPMPKMDSKDREKMMKDLQEQMKSMKGRIVIPKMEGRTFGVPPVPPMPGMSMHSSDIAAISKSLNATQRNKNRKQGFLYWSELTQEQQAMLGIRDSAGSWSITYSRDGESFTVKSDQK